MLDEGFAAIGKRARQDGLTGALAEPLENLLDAARLSTIQAKIIAGAAKALRLRTVGDLCRPDVDAYVDRLFGRRVLRSAAEALAEWLAERRSDDDPPPDEEDDLEGPVDLFSAQALRLASTARARMAPPPSSVKELRQWATEHGVLERLADPAPAAALLGLGERMAIQTVRTIEEVLTAVSRPGFGGGSDRWLARVRRDAAVAHLVRFAENLAFLRDRRSRATPAAVVDPSLAGFERALLATRARVAAETPAAAARPEGAALPAPLRFAGEPPRLIYDEGGSPRDQVLLGSREPELVDIQLAGWQSENLSVHCRCAEAVRGCPHPLAALDAARELLRDPSAPAYTPLREFLSTPAWTRLLGRLDRALAALPPRGAGEAERVVWRVTATAEGMGLLEAQRQTRTARGSWSAGSRLSLAQLASRPALLASAADFRAAEILTDGLGAGLSATFGAIPGRTWRALEVLAGAPNVFLAERKEAPVAIQMVVPRVRFCRPHHPAGSAEGTIELRVALGERLVDPAELIRRAPDGRHYIEADPAANVCRLALLEPELVALAEAFSAEPAPIPDDALAEVLRRMERIERVAAVDLPPELRGSTVEPDERLVCRLTPLADEGLRLEVRVRPLPGADDHPPGEGPRMVVARREGERTSAERTLEREREAGLRLAAEIGLGEVAPVAPWVFDLVDGALAFAAFLALRGRTDGTVIEWPAEGWQVGEARRSALRLRVTERRDWFGIEGGVEIDGQLVPFRALLEAVRRGRRYVVLGPRRFAVIEDELRARLVGAQDLIHESRGAVEIGGPAVEAVAELVEDPSALEAIPSFRALRADLGRAARLEPRIPEGLAATLRPYQAEGFRWLARLSAGRAGAVLADDMGLGKTVQVLAVLLERAELGPALVVAPTSVVPNWIAEAARFAPSLRPVLLRGADRASRLEGLGPKDLVVTSYALAVRDAEALAAVHFSSLVLDEAQALKNASTQRARAIRELDAEWRVALSGTPIENHLGELWSLFRVISPALFGSWEQFRERFALPIERHGDGERRQALGRLLRPFLLRRTKQDVAPELPAKTEVQRLIDLAPGERRLYEQTRLAALAELGQGGGDPDGQRRIHILAALTRLRQLACHPRLGDEKTTLPSSKVRALVEVLTEVREAGHRALVFSQFTRFLDLVRGDLAAAGFKLLSLDGSTPPPVREERVATFQRGEADVFLVSLRAGGTGLNLTAADYVVHLDPWWNPAVEDQATDRAHRIGQTRAVTVVRLIARGTVEEAVLALHQEKRGLAASILDGADTAGRLGAEELLALLAAHPDQEAADETAAEEAPEAPGPVADQAHWASPGSP